MAVFEFPLFTLFDQTYVSSDPKKTFGLCHIGRGEAWCVFETEEQAAVYRKAHASRKRFRVNPVAAPEIMLDLLRIANAVGIGEVHYTNSAGASGTVSVARFRRELLGQQREET